LLIDERFPSRFLNFQKRLFTIVKKLDDGCGGFAVFKKRHKSARVAIPMDCKGPPSSAEEAQSIDVGERSTMTWTISRAFENFSMRGRVPILAGVAVDGRTHRR